jgi:hypothetical protein
MTLEETINQSEIITSIATHIISHAIVDHEEQLDEERFLVASAFLQRVTSTHLCNHKLTEGGIVYKYKDQEFQLHESYKTTTLTRYVYEHLVMLFFLYKYPSTEDARDVVWNYWKINSMKNMLDYLSGVTATDNTDQADDKDASAKQKARAEDYLEIESLRRSIFATRTGYLCREKLDEWTAPDKPTQNGIIAFFRNRGRLDVRRVSYNQAWKYLFPHDDMADLYRHLSIHCHPIYNGLLQYQSQQEDDDDAAALPLFLSNCFLACLCRLFLNLLPDGPMLMKKEFSVKELQVFETLYSPLTR